MLIDGVEIGKINLKWLRANVGLVQQEPVLFANGIYIFNFFRKFEGSFILAPAGKMTN